MEQNVTLDKKFEIFLSGFDLYGSKINDLSVEEKLRPKKGLKVNEGRDDLKIEGLKQNQLKCI